MVPEPPPAELAPSRPGVLGVLPGIIGTLQAIETVKLILDLGDPLIGRLLAYDSLEATFREYKVRVDPTNEITYENRDPHRGRRASTTSACRTRCRHPRRRADGSPGGADHDLPAHPRWRRPPPGSGTGCCHTSRATVLAVDLPGRNDKPADLATLTVDDEVASVLADVEAAGLPDPIVLVAHSSGGLVVPGVVAGLGGRVAHVVLNAASVPPEGGSGLDCMQDRHREGVLVAVEQARSREDRVDHARAPRPIPRPSAPPTVVTPSTTRPWLSWSTRFAACATPLHHYFQPVHWSIAGDVPVTYVLNERDRPVPPAAQEEMSAGSRRPPRWCGSTPDTCRRSPTPPPWPTCWRPSRPDPGRLFGDGFGAYRAESVPRTIARTSTWGVGKVPWRRTAATTVEVS